MLKLLITGCNGFVGTNLVRAFKQHYDLYGLDITPGVNQATGPDTEARESISPEKIFSWDDLDSLPEADAVIHLAGKAHDTKDTTEPEEYFSVNLGLTKRIFDWFMASDARTFIFFSSVKAVADSVEGAVLTEDAVPNPQTPYGRSKLAAEEYIREALSAQRRAQGTGQRAEGEGRRARSAERREGENAQSSYNDRIWPVTTHKKRIFILRPCMIHGPGNKGNLNLLYQVVKKGIPYPLGAFDNKRSFVSIANVTFVVRQLLEKDISPGIYNLADDEPLSTNELIRMMPVSQGKSARIWRLPRGLVRGIARTGDLLRLPLNTERLKKLTDSYMVSNARLKNALNIDSLPVAARNGMMSTLSHLSFPAGSNEK